MESGSVNISGTSDDGIQCDLDGTASTGITEDHEDEDTGNIYISGGNITITSSALAAKGIKSEGDIYISDDAIINVTVSGNGKWDDEDLETSAACGISAEGNITITNGTISLIATGSGGKGIKCDGILNVSGGNTVSLTNYGNSGGNNSLEYLENPNITIIVLNDEILVEGCENCEVNIFDIEGRKVSNKGLNSGVYFVKAGNNPTKKIVIIK
jgi:hypothetical protein